MQQDLRRLAPGFTKERVSATVRERNTGVKCSMAGACCYELPTSSGFNHCAIGCFIPLGHPAMEFMGSVHSLLDKYPDLQAAMPFTSRDDLRRFQQVHDVLSPSFVTAGPTAVWDAVDRFLAEEVA